jgi:hypothetical protein
MITALWISGRRLFAGEGRRPNNLLWILTLNTPSLDSDLASRGVPISIRKADYSATWREVTLELIDKHRWGIVSALVELLQIPTSEIMKPTRWGPWENQVLAKVEKWAPDNDISLLMKLIQDRQRAFDDETNENELVREELEQAVISSGNDPDLNLHFIPNAVAAKLYNRATGLRQRHRNALRAIDDLVRTEAISTLEKTRHGRYGRGYYWTTEKTPDDAEIVVVELQTGNSG